MRNKRKSWQQQLDEQAAQRQAEQDALTGANKAREMAHGAESPTGQDDLDDEEFDTLLEQVSVVRNSTETVLTTDEKGWAVAITRELFVPLEAADSPRVAMLLATAANHRYPA